MPITPQPEQQPMPLAGPPDLWSGATFYDVTLVNMTRALIASGKYAPGPLIMSLALALAAELMYQTGRWVRPAGMEGVVLTPEQAAEVLKRFRITS